MSVHAQLIPSPRNICTVKSGNAAPTHERTTVFAENADALYCKYVSTRYAYICSGAGLCQLPVSLRRS